ncbi:MAG: flagellar hook protein FliD [Gammaproteobacteria bacterium]|nr:MAG: flagellar hook protein FliD [Gammaproteobacteria bacterium]
MAISSPGIGSGLDVNNLVTQLLALERRPLALLDRSEAALQAQLSAYGSLKGAVSALQTSMNGLATLSKYQTMTAKAGDATILAATAAATAAAGSHSIEVKELASAHRLASGAFTDIGSAVGTGTISIRKGTYSGGVFTPNADKPEKSVSISAGNNSLAGIRDAINNAGMGVTASIVNVGGNYKLSIASDDTGAANSLKIAVTDSGDGNNLDDSGLSKLAYDPAGSAGSGKNLTETIAAANALLKVDGIDNISKSNNTVTDVLEGITLNLLKKSDSGVATTLTVARDTNGIKNAAREFVKAYNQFADTASRLTAYDKEAQQGSVLQGDVSTLMLASRIRNVINSTQRVPGGSLASLSDVGISFQRDGTLALDETRLQTAIDAKPGEIGGLFANTGKASDSLIKFSGATPATNPGDYAVNITQAATQGAFTGAATAALADTLTPGTFDAPFVIDANNNNLVFKVNGSQSGTIALTAGSYATTAALVAEIQSRINSDAALLAAGAGVTVSFDSGADKLALTSSAYGSASTIEIVSVDANTAATLGFSAAAGTAGLDVAGSIAGFGATGSGKLLTGAAGSPTAGLAIEILGGATGNRGIVSFARGYASRLEDLAKELLAETGPIAARTTGIDASIDALSERRTDFEARLVEIEKRLRKQYSNLDTLMGRLTTTSNFLAQQLSVLPGFGING